MRNPATHRRTAAAQTRAAAMRPMRLLFLAAACMLVALVVVVAPAEGGAAPPRIEGSINTIVIAAFQRALLAYQLSHPEFTPVTLSLNSGLPGGLAAASSGSYDFTVTSSSVPDTLKAGFPSLEAFPIMAAGIAPYYSLPTGTVGTAMLTLTTVAMCKIWRGNLTHWDDPEIRATNPALTFPHTAIIPVQLGFSNDGSTAASRLCTKVDPVWRDTIGITGLPVLPYVANLVSIPLAGGSAGIASYVLDNPGAIGMSSPVAALKALRANMINQANKIVSPTPATVSQAFLELAANGILPGGNGFDLSNAQSAYAWPANICFWLMVDLTSVRTTCAAKSAVLKFLLWIYTSEVVVELANSFQIAMPPLLYLEQSGMLDRMRKSVLCDGSALVEADSTGASIRGNAIITNQLTFLTTMYRDVDATYTYGFESMADPLALDRVAGGEIDFAVVDTNAVTDTQIDIFRSSTPDASGNPVAGGMILPVYLVGVVPTFNLPAALKSYFATRTVANDLGLPDLYPLKMNMELLALIFMGSVSSWTDDRMLALNPQLGPWFDAVPLAPRKLLSVVCCTVPTDAMVAGTILTRALIKTEAIKGALGATSAAALTAKTIWPALAALRANQVSNQTTVDREDTVYIKLILQPGTVSYRQINSGVTNNQIEFQMVRTNRLGELETVSPTPAAMAKCVPESYLSDPALFRATIGNPKRRDWVTDEPGCWPLVGAASIAIASAYSPLTAIGSTQKVTATDISPVTGRMFSPCIRAQKNLELLRWMQISPLLSPAAINSGLVRLADFQPIQSFIVNDRLNWATCDSKTILITLPIVWKVPSAVTVFAIVAVTLLVLLCIITLIALYAYKSHSAIRGASPIFLAQVAIGIILLAASLLAWSAPVSDDSCMSFQWLVNLGFTLSFSPLFAKTWRIYQIFSAKKIRVVKITNSRLVWVVAGMLAFELIVLAAWTGVSPLRPTLFERSTTQADGAIKQTTHCAVDDSAGRAFLALEGTFKGVLLFLGSVYGFTTRKVSANFSESNTIAWAIYNVVFSGLVVGAILVFLDTLGDTLMWLVLFLMLWIACATWAFVFVPKFSAIVAAEKNHDPTHHSTSLASLSAKDGSVTFASITGFTVAQLQNYRVALEAQLIKVRQALGLSRHQREQENVVLVKQSTHASNNHGGSGHNLSSGGGGAGGAEHSGDAARRLKLFESSEAKPESGRLRNASPTGLRISPSPTTPTATGSSTRYSATTTDVAGPSIRPNGSPANGPRKAAFGVNAPTQAVRPSQQQASAPHMRKHSSDQSNRILAGHEENGIRIHSLPTGASLDSQSYDQPQISSPSGPSPQQRTPPQGASSPTAAESAAAAVTAISVPQWDTDAAARDELQPSPQPSSRPSTAEREGAVSPVVVAAPPTPTRVAISLAVKPSSRAQ